MKITRSQLRQLIKEELNRENLLKEGPRDITAIITQLQSAELALKSVKTMTDTFPEGPAADHFAQLRRDVLTSITEVDKALKQAGLAVNLLDTAGN
jgi:hypothetical protein